MQQRFTHAEAECSLDLLVILNTFTSAGGWISKSNVDSTELAEHLSWHDYCWRATSCIVGRWGEGMGGTRIGSIMHRWKAALLTCWGRHSMPGSGEGCRQYGRHWRRSTLPPTPLCEHEAADNNQCSVIACTGAEPMLVAGA